MGTSGPRALGLGCDLLQPARVARGQDRQFVAVEIFVQPEVEGARPPLARDPFAGLHEVLQERAAVERRVVVWLDGDERPRIDMCAQPSGLLTVSAPGAEAPVLSAAGGFRLPVFRESVPPKPDR